LRSPSAIGSRNRQGAWDGRIAGRPLNEHVVAPGALAVHADGDAARLQNVEELGAGELAALVGVEDLRLISQSK
jgi:hypothetical protein